MLELLNADSFIHFLIINNVSHFRGIRTELEAAERENQIVRKEVRFHIKSLQ